MVTVKNHIYQRTWSEILVTFVFSNKGTPSAPQHTDSHKKIWENLWKCRILGRGCLGGISIVNFKKIVICMHLLVHMVGSAMDDQEQPKVAIVNVTHFVTANVPEPWHRLGHKPWLCSAIVSWRGLLLASAQKITQPCRRGTTFHRLGYVNFPQTETDVQPKLPWRKATKPLSVANLKLYVV